MPRPQDAVATASIEHRRGMLAYQAKRFQEAEALLRRAAELSPDSARVQNDLGTVLGSVGRTEEALICFQRAVALAPSHARSQRNPGVALQKLGRFEEAAEAFWRTVELDPSDAASWRDLGKVLHELGELQDAVACRRRFLALRPQNAAYHSNLLVALHYCPEYSPQQLFQEHLAWAARHAEPLTAAHVWRDIDRDPARPLRVGYLSGHFHDYPAPRFFGPILEHHDRSRFAVYCYSDVKQPDAITERLKGVGIKAPSDQWRDISSLSDEDVAKAIAADKIDILVDLAGHMDNHRLSVFARKPAPVQVAYIGYPDTTGMSAMDYRLTDAWHDPIGETDRFNTEKLIRLDQCCWCYDPWQSPEIEELPALSQGHVTFGGFNRLIKLTRPMMRLWARIMDELPTARLTVLATREGGKDYARHRLANGGINPDRVNFLPRSPREQYLVQLGRVDIHLDTFPYAGMTTTCDALWMGVPTVTLAGKTHISRVGVSLMQAMEMPEWIAENEVQYVEIAVKMAKDLPRLAELRKGLRPKMKASPIGDGRGLTKRIEDAYRQMWRTWCRGRPA